MCLIGDTLDLKCVLLMIHSFWNVCFTQQEIDCKGLLFSGCDIVVSHSPAKREVSALSISEADLASTQTHKKG